VYRHRDIVYRWAEVPVYRYRDYIDGPKYRCTDTDTQYFDGVPVHTIY